jgi:hypothetical protein
VAWARVLGHDEAAELLQETLDEEKAADEKLTAIAEGGINESAAAGAHGDEEEETEAADEERPRAVRSSRRVPVGARKKTAARRR